MGRSLARSLSLSVSVSGRGSRARAIGCSHSGGQAKAATHAVWAEALICLPVFAAGEAGQRHRN